MIAGKDKVIYTLDTNALIGFAICLPIELNKVFCSKLEESLKKGTVSYWDAFVDEIKFANDGLKDWCKTQKGNVLLKSIDDTLRNRAFDINTAHKMIDETTGKSTFDTYLIAYAEINKLTIFSRESPRVKDTELYKIPDVCRLLGVR